MTIAYFVVPQLVLLGWFFLNRRAAHEMAAEHSSEDAMLQHLRDYLHEGYDATSRNALLLLTKKASRGAFRCERQSFFQPLKGGNWSEGDTPIDYLESSLLAAIAAQGLPIDRRVPAPMGSELLEAAYQFMDQRGINVLVPVSDSMNPQWVWASYFADRHTTPEIDALRAWQMAMQSVVERSTLRLASAHLALLEKDAASATQVLRVLLPESPCEVQEGMEWAGTLRRENGEPPVLFATYAQGEGKVLVVFAEVTAPGLAAVILASALRGFCDSIVAGSKGGTPLRPERVMARLNQYVWRPDETTSLSCVVALFDTQAGRVDYAAAGEPCWLHVKLAGDVTPVAATGPGLGVAGDIDYLPKCIVLEHGDSHLLLGIGQKDMECTSAHLHGRAQAASHIQSAELEDYIDDLTDLMGSLGGDQGRTPAAVVIRPQPRD